MPAPSEPAARFHDGRSAVARPVELELGRDALVIRDPVGTVYGVWPWGKLRVLATRPQLRLAFGAAAPRLTVVDPALAAEVRRLLPSPWPRRLRWSAGLGTATAAVAAAVYATVVVLPLHAVDWLPASWARALGEAVLQQLAEGAEPCTGPGYDVLERTVAGLAAAPGPDGTAAPAVRLVVLDTALPNAFALPGGIVVVTRGLIGRAPAAEALVGVLAHEIGHVALRHPDRGVIRGLGLNGLLAIVGAGGGGLGQVADLGALLASLRYSREQEREADAWSIRLLGEAGIGGAPTAALLERLGREQGGGPDFLSTHPGVAERAARLRAVEGTGTALGGGEWAQVRALCGPAAAR